MLHLRPIAERMLYEDIQLPMPARYSLSANGTYAVSLSALLARTLFDRPDLAARIARIELWLVDRRLVAHAHQTLLPSDGPYFSIFSQALTRVSTFAVNWAVKSKWMSELSRSGEMALQAVIVGSLPNLKSLLLSGHTALWNYRPGSPYMQNMIDNADRPYLDLALRCSTCTNFTVKSLTLPSVNL